MAEESIGLDRVAIPIRYVERCMDTSYRLSPGTSLDEKTQDDISRHAKKTYFKFLGFKKEDFQDDPFGYSASGLYDSDGEPRKASGYEGEFQVFLNSANREQGFPYIVHKLKTQLKDCEGDKTTLQTQLDEAQWTEEKAEEKAGEKSGEKKGKKKNKKKGNKRDDREGNSPQAKTEAVSIGNDDLKSKMEAMSRIVIDLKSRVDALEVDNDALLGDNKTLKSRVDDLEVDNDALLGDNKTLKSRVDALEGDNKILRSRMDAVLKSCQLATKVQLRIALDEARKKLIVDLGRGPGNMTWKDFILTLSAAELAQLLVKVSRKALDLMSTGKKDLSTAVHQGAQIDEIAAAITTTQKKHQAWLDIFKYAYNIDAQDLVFLDVPEES